MLWPRYVGILIPYSKPPNKLLHELMIAKNFPGIEIVRVNMADVQPIP